MREDVHWRGKACTACSQHQGGLSKARVQPNLHSQSKEGKCFIFEDGLVRLVPCYPLQWGSSFRKSKGKTTSTKIKHSAFTHKWHQIFLSHTITLSSCLTEPVLPLQPSTCGRCPGQGLAQGSGVMFKPKSPE